MPEDKEYLAIGTVIKALEDLSPEERGRVMDYVLKRFDLPKEKNRAQNVGHQPAEYSRQESVTETPVRAAEMPLDIRALRNEKKPNTAVQMAVLVAYYLKVTNAENKDAIGTSDIETYFTQAGYPLPEGKNGARDTLNNAKKAGYFEPAGKGLFRLNPVGFNLAAYNMPTSGRSMAKASK